MRDGTARCYVVREDQLAYAVIEGKRATFPPQPHLFSRKIENVLGLLVRIRVRVRVRIKIRLRVRIRIRVSSCMKVKNALPLLPKENS